MSAIEPPFLAELRQEFARVAEADAQAAAAASAAPRTRRLRLRRIRLGVVLPALASVAVLGGITVVATDVVSRSGDTPPGSPSGPTPQSPASSGFREDLVAHLAVLRRAPTSADALDPSITADLSPDLVPEGALRIALPPAVSEDAGQEGLTGAWLVPADDGTVVIVAARDAAGGAALPVIGGGQISPRSSAAGPSSATRAASSGWRRTGSRT